MLNSTKRRNVLNVHVVGERTISDNIPRITLPHTIASGPVRNEDYGLDLARRFLPERVTDNAEKICKYLQDKNAGRATGPATKALRQNKLILALPDLLKQAYNSTMDDSALASYLKKLQTEFTIRMNMAAEDDADEHRAGQGANHRMERPVLEKPSEQELAEWKAKCDAAERRVMHANMAHSQERKRPVSGDEDDEYLQKRNRTDDATESVSLPTPINRSSLIEELRRETCTPTTRVSTPSSLTMDTSEPDAESESVVEMPVPSIDMDADSLSDGTLQRPLSVSSDNRGDDNDGRNTPDMQIDDNDALSTSSPQSGDPAAAEPEQPLQRFQPLEKWYARERQAADASTKESEETRESIGPSQSRSATHEFLGVLSEDGYDELCTER